MAVSATTPIELVEAVYAKLGDRVATGRRRLGKPLTLTEKILVNHLRDPEDGHRLGGLLVGVDRDPGPRQQLPGRVVGEDVHRRGSRWRAPGHQWGACG